MANTTFAGAIAEQNYQWEYTCEFCGRRVEKTGKLTASYGFGRNVNTRWTVNAAWSQEAIAQAERKLAESKAQTESLSQSGHWAPSGDDGRCRLRRRDIALGCDFTRTFPEIAFRIVVTVQLYKFVHMAFMFLAEYVIWKIRKRREKKAAALAQREDDNGRQQDE